MSLWFSEDVVEHELMVFNGIASVSYLFKKANKVEQESLFDRRGSPVVDIQFH